MEVTHDEIDRIRVESREVVPSLTGELKYRPKFEGSRRAKWKKRATPIEDSRNPSSDDKSQLAEASSLQPARDSYQDEEKTERQPAPKRKVSSYRRAQLAYEQAREERYQLAEKRRIEREQKEADKQEFASIRRLMSKAVKKRSRKGQPKLDAQMEALLERIEYRERRAHMGK